MHFYFLRYETGLTRHKKVSRLRLYPMKGWVTGYSFQLAINQHQFSLHALGFCHLDKDVKYYKFNHI